MVERDVYVISDLHLGGPVGSQMMRRPEVLAAFVEQRAKGSTSPCELVIAGDFVDFLADLKAPDGDPQEPFLTEEQAIAVLRHIAQRSVFATVFEALADFLARGHTLTILLGNHDIELSLPSVRRELMRLLAVVPGSSFRFIYDGEAYVIGNALIEHGNRYDGFNVVNHDALRRVRSLYSRKLPIREEDAFVAPVGSRLVVEIMNPIKKRYPFVDLLKPEREAVIPLLLALDPGLRRNIFDIVRLYREKTDHDPVRPAEPSIGGDISSDSDDKFRGCSSIPDA